MSILKKLLVLFFAVIIPPVIAIVGFTFLEITSKITEQNLQALEEIAKKQENKINQIVLNWHESVSAFASRTELRIILDQYYIDQTVEQQKVNTLLKLYEEENLNIENITIVKSDGTVVAASDEEFINTNINDQTEEHINFDVVDFFTHNNSSGVSHFHVIENIILSSEEKLFLDIQFSPSSILAVVRDYSGLGSSGDTILATYQNDKINFIFNPRRKEEFVINERNIESNQELPIAKALQKHETEYESVRDYADRKVMAVTKYLDLPDWGMVVKIDHEETYTVISNLRTSYILISLLTLIYLIVVAYYFSRIFTHPIVELTETTNKIAEKGIFKQKIEIHSNDEIGKLAENFNVMVNKLASSYSNLEDKVRERTVELDSKIGELQKLNKFMIGREIRMIELKNKIEQLQKEIEELK